MTEASISQAAAILGCSVDTIRRKIKRGELVATMDSNGRYTVVLDESQAAPKVGEIHNTRSAELEAENAQLRAELKRLAEAEELRKQQCEILQRQIDDLRQYRQADADAQQELRQLILALTTRIPQIEAPREVQDPQQKRSWWPFGR